VDHGLAEFVAAGIAKEIVPSMRGLIVAEGLLLTGRAHVVAAIRVCWEQRPDIHAAVNKLSSKAKIRQRVCMQVNEAFQWRWLKDRPWMDRDWPVWPDNLDICFWDQNRILGLRGSHLLRLRKSSSEGKVSPRCGNEVGQNRYLQQPKKCGKYTTVSVHCFSP
jgi:hypothetical protein